MITYPNQKIVTIFKTEIKKARNKEDQEQFLQIGNNTWQAACSTLTYSAFKLYLYFTSNKNGYSFALSYEAVNEQLSMNRKTYDKAIKELKEYGYLRQVRGNNWVFNDVA